MDYLKPQTSKKTQKLSYSENSQNILKNPKNIYKRSDPQKPLKSS